MPTFNPTDRFFPNREQVTLNMIAATTAIPNYLDTDPGFDPSVGIVHKEPSVRIRALLHPSATLETIGVGARDENRVVRAWAARVEAVRFPHRPILGPDGV